ncbi:MAG: glycosyltransferase [Acidobacteria bacterium]|nr:glycosyltransferase [Acidobacteriota bacterium]
MSDLQRVTPVVLTANEEANVGRTLEALQWARRVVVVDSGSTDATERIARGFANVSWFSRSFDRHERQWRFGVHETGIDSDYVLALDADHQVPPAFLAELNDQFLPGGFDGGVAGFDYAMEGRNLGGSLYPPRVVIAKRAALGITQPGHTQQFSIGGSTYRFRARLVHDDRKPLERFVQSQIRYSKLEADRILQGRSRGWVDRLRRAGLMPPIAAALAYLRARGPFGGAGAVRYACERATFECLLAMRLIASELDEAEPSAAAVAEHSR